MTDDLTIIVPAHARGHPKVIAFQEWISTLSMFGEPPPSKLKRDQPVDIPHSLQTPEFFEAWELWIKFRRQERYSCRTITLNHQLKTLSAYAPAIAIAAIHRAIDGSWRSLHPDKERGAVAGGVAGNADWKINAQGSFGDGD